ncbi:MAG: SLC13 family permease [Spirochaetales bacterium]|nr:SLC13 family permease [Spirochaetales bacterium]
MKQLVIAGVLFSLSLPCTDTAISCVVRDSRVCVRLAAYLYENDIKPACHCRATTRQSLVSFPIIAPRHLRNKNAICDTIATNCSNLQNQEKVKKMSAGKIFQKIFSWCKKEIVFCITFLLALVSMLFVKPDAKYISYIDFGTLLTLFSLMAVVSGWRRTGLFGALGNIVCRKVHSQRGLCLTLVLLCFFTSMIITNDVALLTFVPFAVVLLSKTSGFLLLYTVVLQTLAANLGSMITPIGNPQNIFLFSKMQLGTIQFMKILFPCTLLSLVLLIFSTMIIKNEEMKIERQEFLSDRPSFAGKNILYTALFILCLLSVVNVIPKWSAAVMEKDEIITEIRKLKSLVDSSKHTISINGISLLFERIENSETLTQSDKDELKNKLKNILSENEKKYS